jgi:hypothetical protein
MCSYVEDHGKVEEFEKLGLVRGLAYSLLGAFEL